MMKKLTVLVMMLFSLCIIQTPVYAGGIDNLMFAGHAGYFAKNLRTGQTLAFNQDDVFPTASTSKLVVALAVYKYLYPAAPTEMQADYTDSIGRMMRVSDNQSFWGLLDEIDQLSFNPLKAVIQDLSLQRTIIHSPEARDVYGYSSVTTPYEMATLFESIFKDSYLDYQKSATLKEELANTIFQDELPRFLPGKVMHKIGQLDDILCDVGIVDDGADQILISIYTRTDRSDEYASDYIAELANTLYNTLKSNAI